MPRSADQHLQDRILEAAQRLWRARGEKGLTLRGVARQVGTTTTTVYKRFPSKDALLHALAERVHQQLIATITSSASLEEGNQRHLRFAENHPQEYKLLFGEAWTSVFAPGRARPVRDWFTSQFAARFGGQPSDYALAHLALFFATHGAASLLTEAKGQSRASARKISREICVKLIKNAGIFKTKSRR
jgi:AcrR family transcriptional regulator